MNNRPIYDISFHNSFDYISEVDRCPYTFRRRAYCIISDSNVEKYHMDSGRVRNAIKQRLCDKVYSFSFQPVKNRRTRAIECYVFSMLSSIILDGNDVICALGGGVVGDM